MKASYWQRGESLDYKNTGEEIIEAGTVVEIGTRIGIAGTDIKPGETGSLHVSGVFEITKKSGEEVKMGEEVYFGEEGITTTPSEGNLPVGYAAAEAATTDAAVLVKLLG